MNLHLRHNTLSINPIDLLVNQVKKLVDLSDIIRMRRSELKLTQENIAFELGCDPATYNRWEKNPELIQYGKLKKLAEVLQTSLVALLRSMEEPGAVNEPMETYGLRARVESQEKEIDLYKQLLQAKESLLDRYREAEKKVKKNT